MAITVVGSSSFVAYTSGQTISVTYPASMQANDLAIFFVEFPDTLSTLPTGWNYLTDPSGTYFYTTGGSGTGGWGIGGFYKKLAGTESSTTINFGTVAAGTGNHLTGIMHVFRGVSPTSPFFNTGSTLSPSASTSLTIPSIPVPNKPGFVIMAIGTHASSSTGQVSGISNANFTGITQISNNSSSSPAGGVAVYRSDCAGQMMTGVTSGTLSTSQLWGTAAIGLNAASGNTTDVVTVSGTGTITVPAATTTALVECWGGGAGGESFGGGASDGGGGGAYAAKTITVTAGASVSYQIGAGGAVASNGGDTWFVNNTTVLAKGGSAPVGGSGTRAGGIGGQASACIGDITANGGNGSASANGGTDATTWQGAGGSSAGSADGYAATAGNNAVTYTPGSAPVTPSGMNSGGGGAATNNTVYSVNVSATAPGGGGATDGNVGMAGQIRITWNPTAPAPSYKQTLILSI